MRAPSARISMAIRGDKAYIGVEKIRAKAMCSAPRGRPHMFYTRTGRTEEAEDCVGAVRTKTIGPSDAVPLHLTIGRRRHRRLGVHPPPLERSADCGGVLEWVLHTENEEPS